MSKQFRTAYVIEKGKIHDVSALNKYADNIVVLLSGKERNEEITKTLREIFVEFSPDRDIVIPTGRVISSFILGYMMGFIPEFTVGIYKNKDYSFIRLWSKIPMRSSDGAI